MKHAPIDPFVEWLLENTAPLVTDNCGIKAMHTRLIGDLNRLMKQVATPRELLPLEWDRDSMGLVSGTGKVAGRELHDACCSLVTRRLGMDGPAIPGFHCLQPRNLATAADQQGLLDLFRRRRDDEPEPSEEIRTETVQKLCEHYPWLAAESTDAQSTLIPMYRTQLVEILVRWRIGDGFPLNVGQKLYLHGWHRSIAPIGLRNWKILVARIK